MRSTQPLDLKRKKLRPGGPIDRGRRAGSAALSGLGRFSVANQGLRATHLPLATLWSRLRRYPLRAYLLRDSLDPLAYGVTHGGLRRYSLRRCLHRDAAYHSLGGGLLRAALGFLLEEGKEFAQFGGKLFQGLSLFRR